MSCSEQEPAARGRLVRDSTSAARTIAVGLALAGALSSASLARAADVAILKSSEVAAWEPALTALRRALDQHSLTEHDLRGEPATGRRVLEGLKGQPVILVALGPLAAQLCRDTAPELPMIFGMVADPAKAGLRNLANATGVAFSTPVKNQLAAFRMVNPGGVRVGVIFDPDNSAAQIEAARAAARVVRLAIVERPVSSERDVPQALRELLRGRDAVDAVWMPADPILLGQQTRRFILSETLKASKPVYSFSKALIAEGALVSDGPNTESIGSQLAGLVERVAAGERAGSIGLAVPLAELVINKRIADRLEIEIPAAALHAADEIR
jgi:putative ABC transport system substrate-binding protein